jgi:CRISPR-associated protein Csc3
MAKKTTLLELSYPEDKPLTFYFIGAVASRHKSHRYRILGYASMVRISFPDGSRCQNGGFCSLPIPPYRDGAEFEETVFLDSAPQSKLKGSS